MTKITGKKVSAEENQGTVSIETGGTERLNISQAGLITLVGTPVWGTAAQSTSGVTTAFTAAGGTAALSGSRWDGGAGTKYAVGDIVAALKAAGILGA